MYDYKKLKVWQQSHQLVLVIYKVTNNFPKMEQYGLVSQMRRAAVSVPANIVEGKARSSAKEYIRFLQISRGSVDELNYFLFLSAELDYLELSVAEELRNQCSSIAGMLNGLIKSIKEVN